MSRYEKGQLRELLSNYGKIDIVWFDIAWPYAIGGARERIPHPRVREDVLDLLTMMKNLQPDIIFDDRGTDLYGGFFSPEQRVPETGLPGYWESSVTITNGRGYWYKGDQVTSKSPAQLIRTMVDIASKGGNFLINVGPRPDGELSSGEYAGLAGLGEWMDANGDSIYDTSRSLFYDLPWGRSTTKGRTLYLHVENWPPSGRLTVPGLRTRIDQAFLLADASRTPLVVRTDGRDPVVDVGAEAPDRAVSVVVLELADEPQVHNIIASAPDGEIVLPASRAEIRSATAEYNFGQNIRAGDYIENFRDDQDRVSWSCAASKSGRYQVKLLYAARAADCGGEFRLSVAGQELKSTVKPTADWTGDILEYTRNYADGQVEGSDSIFEMLTLGQIEVETPGEILVSFQPISVTHPQLLYLRQIVLTPLP